MRKYLISLTAMILYISTLLSFSACSRQFESYRPINDVNNLEGRKIGVMMGWSADYILSPREGKDLYLYRYDTNADMLMALCYRQLDAITVDALTWRVMSKTNSGLRIVEEPVAMDGYVSYVIPEKKHLQESFNKFLKEYKQTQDYQSLVERINKFDGTNYSWREGMKLTGTGEKIVMAYDDECYPFCYVTPDGKQQGFDVELMYAFANANNYQLELINTTELDIYLGLQNKAYDMIFGQVSIAYAGEAELAGLLITDEYFNIPLYLVEVDNIDDVVINEEIETAG